MATIEYITKRIEGKKAEIVKLQKKIERMEKAQATNWEVNPYYYDENDLKWAKRDLDKAFEALAKYESDMNEANDKAMSRNVPAITEFLDGWKASITAFYTKGIDEYYTAKEECRKMFAVDYDKACKMSKELRTRVHGRYEKQENINRFGRKVMTEVKVEDGDLEAYATYLQYVNKTEAIERLDKDLTAEYDRKYDFIIERTNAIVKVITDASHLEIGAKGDLNGYIIGTDGTAKIQTIGAGGYNIQCFHFRTLIHSI